MTQTDRYLDKDAAYDRWSETGVTTDPCYNYREFTSSGISPFGTAYKTMYTGEKNSAKSPF